jgi:hypothetical protein
MSQLMPRSATETPMRNAPKPFSLRTEDWPTPQSCAAFLAASAASESRTVGESALAASVFRASLEHASTASAIVRSTCLISVLPVFRDSGELYYSLDILPVEAALRFALLSLTAFVVSACALITPDPEPGVERARPSTRAGRETVTVKDADLERRALRLELRVIEKETEVEQLQSRLNDTRDEVVRTMAKLETAASRAEAASGMAEAEVALQALRTAAAGQLIPEIDQVQKLFDQSSEEFGKQNFGGALYLASHAKALASAGRARLAGGNLAGSARPGETAFALPIRLKVENKGNVREGPSTTFPVTFEVAPGEMLTGYSYSEDWIRVSDDTGRSGWIFRNLVTRP